MTWRRTAVRTLSRTELARVRRTLAHTGTTHARAPSPPLPPEELHTAPLHRRRPWGQRPLSAWYRRACSLAAATARAATQGESRKEPRSLRMPLSPSLSLSVFLFAGRAVNSRERPRRASSPRLN